MGIVAFFFQLLNQLRLSHWQAETHAGHVALGDAYDKLDDLIDNFVEVYMGRRAERVTVEPGDLSPMNVKDIDLDDFLVNCVKFLEDSKEQLGLDADETDLLNIRDEMVAVLNKLRYLLSLK